MKKIAVVALTTLFAVSSAWGIDLSVRPARGSSMEDFFFSGMATSAMPRGTGPLTIKVYLSCFASNLLNVARPVSPMAAIYMIFGIGPLASTPLGTGVGDLSVQFPGWMVWARNPDDLNAWQNRNDPAFSLSLHMEFKQSNSLYVGTASGKQNVLFIRPPTNVDTGISFTTNGDRVGSGDPLKYLVFQQNLVGHGNCFGPKIFGLNLGLKKERFQVARLLSPEAKAGGGGDPLPSDPDPISDPVNPDDTASPDSCTDLTAAGWNPEVSARPYHDDGRGYRPFYQQYIGPEGDLTGQWRHSWSADFKTLEIFASFPSAPAFCDAYFSPLMLFFGNRRPHLTARAGFEVSPGVASTAWPEYDESWGLLALDRNRDGRINDGFELFGSRVGIGNGFEALREFDENHDGVIDRRDPVFEKLLVWRDSTGKGKTLKKDLFTLDQMKVKSISLRYDSKETIVVGRYGEFRERASFEFRSSRGPRKGQVVDVWFNGGR